MEEIMSTVFFVLAAAVGFYSILIFIRIILSWFSSLAVPSKPVQILSLITDPYLNWWRGKLNLRIGILDLSPIAGIVALSILQNILNSLAYSGRITIGFLLSVLLMSVWRIFSFILGFCFFLLILRLIAYLTNRNMYSHFWKVIDSITQPILYRLNRIMFGDKIPGYLKGIIFSSLLLGAIWIGGGFIIPRLAILLSNLPL